EDEGTYDSIPIYHRCPRLVPESAIRVLPLFDDLRQSSLQLVMVGNLGTVSILRLRGTNQNAYAAQPKDHCGAARQQFHISPSRKKIGIVYRCSVAAGLAKLGVSACGSGSYVQRMASPRATFY